MPIQEPKRIRLPLFRTNQDELEAEGKTLCSKLSRPQLRLAQRYTTHQAVFQVHLSSTLTGLCLFRAYLAPALLVRTQGGLTLTPEGGELGCRFLFLGPGHCRMVYFDCMLRLWLIPSLLHVDILHSAGRNLWTRIR